MWMSWLSECRQMLELSGFIGCVVAAYNIDRIRVLQQFMYLWVTWDTNQQGCTLTGFRLNCCDVLLFAALPKNRHSLLLILPISALLVELLDNVVNQDKSGLCDIQSLNKRGPFIHIAHLLPSSIKWFDFYTVCMTVSASLVPWVVQAPVCVCVCVCLR